MKLIASAKALREVMGLNSEALPDLAPCSSSTASPSPPPVYSSSPSASTGQSCTCALGPCAGWESLTEERWPTQWLRQVGTLRNPDIDEPTFEECHPNGTRYDSDLAPVAVNHFPYNRCDLWQCAQCQRHVLRYTEFGGYYVDHRVRAVNPTLIAD